MRKNPVEFLIFEISAPEKFILFRKIFTPESITKDCSLCMAWWPLSANKWKFLTQFILSGKSVWPKFKFYFPISGVSRKEMIRKMSRMIHFWMEFGFSLIWEFAPNFKKRITFQKRFFEDFLIFKMVLLIGYSMFLT